VRLYTLVMLRIRPCLYTNIDTTHLHTTHIRLSSLPLVAFIFTKGWMNEDVGEGEIFFKKGVRK
jgi:hypothetical protein